MLRFASVKMPSISAKDGRSSGSAQHDSISLRQIKGHDLSIGSLWPSMPTLIATAY
jgi:hypothetical protein